MHVLLIFLFSFSALAGDFFEVTKDRWLSTKEYRVNPKLNQDQSVEKPKGAHIKLMELVLYTGNFQLIKDCLFFHVPTEKSPGKLYIHTIDIKESCDEKLLESSKIVHSNIYNFSFKVNDQILLLNVDTEQFKYELKNYNNDLAVDISLLEDSKNTAIMEGELCYKVSDTCEVTMKNRCEFCPSSALNIVDSRCQSDFSKICSAKSCGEVGQPACIRGYKATSFSQDYCINDSPIAFCRDNLRVLCVDDKLVCR